MNLRVLIADDELPARRRVRDLIRRQPGYEIVAECMSGAATLATIRHERPDLLFLDVQMPGLSGLDVLRALEVEERPVVVFTTAYDQYALRAFDEHAIDYLLKPYSDERFNEALERAARLLRGLRVETWARQLGALLDQPTSVTPVSEGDRPPNATVDCFTVRERGVLTVIRTEEIDWVEAAGDYMKLHAGKATYMLRATMDSMRERLDPRVFLRVHRSAIVRVDRVRELQPYFHGDYVLALRDGTKVRMSRSYHDSVAARLGLRD